MALSFESARLNVSEITGDDDTCLLERAALLDGILGILTPAVVENLPPYFHDVDTKESAQQWLDKMLSESRLCLVTSTSGTLMGFLFAYVENGRDAHIGYLLKETFWGKGFASELLQGFITHVTKTESWIALVGGVDTSNVASAHLLKKLGFVEQPAGPGDVVFYVYTLPRPFVKQ